MLNEFRRQLLDAVEYSDYIASFGDPSREILNVDTYSYVVEKNDTATTITSAATSRFNIIMDSDSDFVCVGLGGYGRVAGATLLTQNPSMLVQISDKSTGRTFFNIPSPMPLISGQGGFPYMLPSPPVIRPRSTLEVSVTAALAGVAFDGFYFVLHGGRIYYR